MPIRTAPITPEQKAQLEEISSRYRDTMRVAGSCEQEYKRIATEILGPYGTGDNPQSDHFLVAAVISADGKALELITSNEYLARYAPAERPIEALSV